MGCQIRACKRTERWVERIRPELAGLLGRVPVNRCDLSDEIGGHQGFRLRWQIWRLIQSTGSFFMISGWDV